MRVLSLFSGIGAHDLGLQWAGMDIVGQVEIDEYCQTVLKKNFPKAKRWTDIHSVTANDIRRSCRHISLITGGFPCQDISTAGKGKGIVEGERSGLWREMWRLIRDLRPDWLLLENVPALRTRGSDRVLTSLESLGYTCWPLVVGAWSVKAPHQRNRLLIIAMRMDNAGSQPKFQGTLSFRLPEKQHSVARSSVDLANSSSELTAAGSLERRRPVVATVKVSKELGSDSKNVSNPDGYRIWQQSRRRCGTCGEESPFAFPAGPGEHQHDWEKPRTAQPGVGGAIDGATRRMALKALGNANPPQIFYVAGSAIMELNKKIKR